jgi:hypothetical protein
MELPIDRAGLLQRIEDSPQETFQLCISGLAKGSALPLSSQLPAWFGCGYDQDIDRSASILVRSSANAMKISRRAQKYSGMKRSAALNVLGIVR